MASKKLTKYNGPTDINISDVDHYVGKDQYLWNQQTQMPEASIQLKLTNNPKGDILGQQFVLCPLLELASSGHCTVFFDVFSFKHIRASAGKLSTVANVVLWSSDNVPLPKIVLAQASTTQATQTATQVPTLTEIAVSSETAQPDTVLYMTDITTGTTQEIFRLSSLQQEGLVVDAFDWSSDGKTIALSLSKLKKNMPYSSDSAGTLLITLDW